MSPPTERLQPPGKTTLYSDLSHLGLLRIAGDGAKKLLQGQLTCNLDEVTPEQSRLGAYCTPQGRMLSLFRIFQYGAAYYLQMPAGIVAETQKTLQKYAVFFKVEITDASQDIDRISVSGPLAEKACQAFFPTLPTAVDSAVIHDAALIIKLPGALPHYEVIGMSPLADLVNIEKTAENAWKMLNITAGIPSIYEPTLGKLLPHEVNLPALGGVSFTKGCFTGQEIIARMHYRGQLKKLMYLGRVTLTQQPLPGADVYTDTATGMMARGTIVDSCLGDRDAFFILFIADKNAVESEQLYVDFAKMVPIELISLPA